MSEDYIELPNLNYFKGSWIIRKKDNQPNEYYLNLIKHINKKYDFSGGIINFNTKGGVCLFNIGNEKHIYMNNLKECSKFNDLEFKNINIKEFEIKKLPSVTFSYFHSIFDKRWKSMPYPTSLLYLGGKTSDADLKTDYMMVPLELKTKKIANSDIWGFTLYDDILMEAKEFFKSQDNYKGIFIAGGPFPTLSPIAVITHFKKINSFLRGECDDSIALYLKIIANLKINSLFQIFKKIRELNGFFYQDKELFIISNLEKKSEMKNMNNLKIDFSLIPNNKLERGLELTLSRGCDRNCIFCSHIHGRKFRIVNHKTLERILKSHNKEIKDRNLRNKRCFYININDDDIFINKRKLNEILSIIKKENYKVYGFQTSIGSFFEKDIKKNLIDMISERDLYVSEPLLWIGTDAFLIERQKRLGKPKFKKEILKKILNEFEIRKVRNYHYWILLDKDSKWEEFLKEFFLIWELSNEFEYFNLLPMNSYIIPYPYTPAYRRYKTGDKNSLVYKSILKSKFSSEYDYPLVLKEKPKDEQLNFCVKPDINLKMLKRIRNKKYFEAFQTIYFYFRKSSYYKNLSEKDRYRIINKLDKSIQRLAYKKI